MDGPHDYVGERKHFLTIDDKTKMSSVRVLVALLESAPTGVSVSLPAGERRGRPDLSQLINARPVRKPETVHTPSPSVA